MEDAIISILRLGFSGHENLEQVCLATSQMLKMQREAHERDREAHERDREAHERELKSHERALEYEHKIFLAASAAHELAVEVQQAELDQLRGLLGTRCILERIALEVGPKKSVTDAISDLFKEGTKFYDYLTLVASARSLKIRDLVEAGKTVYRDLSSRVHHGEGDQDFYEAEKLNLSTSTVVALAAVFKFNRRTPTFLREKLPSPALTPPQVSPSTSTTTSPAKSDEALNNDESGKGGGGSGSKVVN